MSKRNRKAWVPPRKLTQAERSTLLDLVYDEIDSGSWYGNRDHYFGRLQRLRKWLESEG